MRDKVGAAVVIFAIFGVIAIYAIGFSATLAGTGRSAVDRLRETWHRINSGIGNGSSPFEWLYRAATIAVVLAMFAIMLSLLVVITVPAMKDAQASIATLYAAPPTPPVVASPVPLTPAEADKVADDGFRTITDRPGVLLVYHASPEGCYLASSPAAPYLEIDVEVCTVEIKRSRGKR